MKQNRFVAERDRQFNIKQELEKCQDIFAYLLSDNQIVLEYFSLMGAS